MKYKSKYYTETKYDSGFVRGKWHYHNFVEHFVTFYKIKIQPLKPKTRSIVFAGNHQIDDNTLRRLIKKELGPDAPHTIVIEFKNRLKSTDIK